MAGCSRSAPTRHEARAATSEVELQGIVFSLPGGWSSAQPACGPPADKTVVVGRWASSCPASGGPPIPASSVRLDVVFAPQSVYGFSGEQKNWHGYAAWLAEDAAFGVTTVRLSVPRLNAVVEAAAPEAVDAHALLDHARPRPTDGLGVPSRASAIFIQGMGGKDMDGLEHNVTVTSPDDVQQLLDDLRDAKPVDSATPTCDPSFYRHTALLTVHRDEPAERTFAVRLDAACGQVVSGTGNAAFVSDELRADIVRLLPNSQLITGP